VQNGNLQSEHLLLEVDLSDGAISSFTSTPNPRAGIISIQPGQFQQSKNGDLFSTAVGFSDGTKGKWGNLTFDRYCYVLPLTQEQSPVAPIHLIMDIDRGIDGSGIMRQIFKKSLFSDPAKLTVVFRESGAKLPDVPIDVTEDKAFETYDVQARRVSTFGGYGSPEENYISDFDVHPTEPWVVTTATTVNQPDGRTVGMITIWNIFTGEPLQRLETAIQIRSPIISSDGKRVTAFANDGLNVFRFG
jgi:hypothetical protein